MAKKADKVEPDKVEPVKDEGLMDHVRIVAVDTETGAVLEESAEDLSIADGPTDPNRARVAAQRLADANSQASQPRPTMPLGGPVLAPGFLAETSPPLSPLMTEDAAGLAIEPLRDEPVHDEPVQQPVNVSPVPEEPVGPTTPDPTPVPEPNPTHTPGPEPSTGEPPPS